MNNAEHITLPPWEDRTSRQHSLFQYLEIKQQLGWTELESMAFDTHVNE